MRTRRTRSRDEGSGKPTMAVPSSALDGECEDEDEDEEDHKPVGRINPPTVDSFPMYHNVERCNWRKRENPRQMTLHGTLKTYVGNEACYVIARVKEGPETYAVNTPFWIRDGKDVWLVPVMYNRGGDARLWLVCTTVKYVNNTNHVQFEKRCTWANVWSWCNTLDAVVVNAARSFAEDWWSKQVYIYMPYSTPLYFRLLKS